MDKNTPKFIEDDLINRKDTPPQSYGDLTDLNTARLVLDSVGREVLAEISNDYMDLLDSSSAIYEKNGDYALGLFSSGWCRFLDEASRDLCETPDNKTALQCGKWHCHESCWTDASKIAIDNDQAVDIECLGGIRLFAIPIYAKGEIVGCINFGYGNPPTDPKRLGDIAKKYNVNKKLLAEKSKNYEFRSDENILAAKKRLLTSAKLIGEIIERSQIEKELITYKEHLEVLVRERTSKLKEANNKLQIEFEERKQLEAKFLQAQKMEAIGVLTGGIAHEFNNLLSPIIGYTELLLTYKHENNLSVNSLEQIHLAGKKAKKLTQKLLTYGRQSVSDKESVKIEKVLEDTIGLLEKTVPSNISFHKKFENDLPSIFAAPNEIQQVLINLCINAIQSMTPSGGICSFDVNYLGAHLFVGPDGDSRSGDFVCISIKDTGCGIDKSIQDRIFDPFFTTKGIGHGSGLGLSVVHGIIEQHEGYIDFKSNTETGTTFYVYLPIVKEEVLSTVENGTLEIGIEHIMLIDDEPMIVDLIKSILEKLGYKVTTFTDSIKALRYFTQYYKKFNLVITDYGMFNMDGRQLSAKLKNICPNIPIILLTGYRDLVSEEDLDEWRIDSLLVKPISMKELSITVKELCRKSSSEE